MNEASRQPQTLLTVAGAIYSAKTTSYANDEAKPALVEASKAEIARWDAERDARHAKIAKAEGRYAAREIKRQEDAVNAWRGERR